jgi:predicted permease
MLRFFISLSLIPAGLFAGILLKRLLRDGGHEEKISLVRLRLQQLALLLLNPAAVMGAIWALPLEDLEIIALPFLEIAAIALAAVLSLVYTGKAAWKAPRRGSHFCLCFYTNVGAMGGLMVYALLGEPGFIFLSFYKMFEEFMYYAVGFPGAARFGRDHKKGGSGLGRILKDPFVLIATSAMTTGLILNTAGIPRPLFYAPLNSVLVPLMSLIMLCSIGMGFEFRGIMKHAESLGSVFIIRYLFVPVIITLAAWVAGLGRIQGGLPLKTVFILCHMPTGFLSAILPGIYGLDQDYTNAGWMATMLFLIPAVPWLYFSTRHLIPLLIAHPLF